MTVKWHNAKTDHPERTFSEYLVVRKTFFGPKISVLRYQYNPGETNDGWTWCTFGDYNIGFQVVNQNNILYCILGIDYWNLG